MEYNKGEHVKYAGTGVCLISDVCVPDFDKSSENNIYYVLSPVFDKATTIFVPTKNVMLLSKMRRLLTKQEIDQIIPTLKNVKIEWIEDRKKRSDFFNDIIKKNDTLELLRMIGCIYIQRQQIEEKSGNRKLSFSDIDVLERAEKLIEEEFSLVLNINIGDVGAYIRQKLEN